METVRHEIEVDITERIKELREEITIKLDRKPDSYPFAQRIRDKSKPNYGYKPSGNFMLLIETADYTGAAEVAILREDNTLVDAKNITKG